uniref:RecA family profile 1 domain-containing protein n=1 Tax=Setaria digitata TaxID=48799 RepID=A0A915PY80_9BILA
MDSDGPEYDEETGLDLFLRLGASWLIQKTGCLAVDRYLSSGIARGKLTEFVGNVASGKTQLCLSITANQLISDEKQQSKIVYIDTNGSFRSSRLLQMLKSRGIQSEDVAKNMLKRVFIGRAYDGKDLRVLLSNIQVLKYSNA